MRLRHAVIGRNESFTSESKYHHKTSDLSRYRARDDEWILCNQRILGKTRFFSKNSFPEAELPIVLKVKFGKLLASQNVAAETGLF